MLKHHLEASSAKLYVPFLTSFLLEAAVWQRLLVSVDIVQLTNLTVTDHKDEKGITHKCCGEV